MTPDIIKKNNCRICSSPDLALVLPMKPTPVADGYKHEQHAVSRQLYPLDIYLCPECGLAQLRDIVNPNILYGNFIYETRNSPGLVQHFAEYVEVVTRRLELEQGTFVVDVGSNDGTLLGFFRDRGLRVLGIDPAAEIANRATAGGIPTLAKYLDGHVASKIVKEHGPAQLVTSNNTMANIDDLNAFVGAIKELLAPDGIFVFETGYVGGVVEKRVFDNIYHEHVSYFSLKALRRLFLDQQMEIFDLERIGTKGGSLRCYVQKAEGTRPVSLALESEMREEERKGLTSKAAFAELSDYLASAKQGLKNILGRIVSEGGTIAGYGASHSVTTLLHYFEIGDSISFLVDDNELKQGTFSPGYCINVLGPDAIYHRKPDYIIILPWRFADMIMAKHKRFLELGGHFIVPLPELRII